MKKVVSFLVVGAPDKLTHTMRVEAGWLDPNWPHTHTEVLNYGWDRV